MKEVFTLPLPTGLSSHDVTFNEKGTRGLRRRADPDAHPRHDRRRRSRRSSPRIVDPTINISHGADITPDQTHLLVTDEQAGAAATASATSAASTSTTSPTSWSR